MSGKVLGYIKQPPLGDFNIWTEREFEAIERAMSNLASNVEESMPLAIQYDQDADPPSYAYFGQASPGSSTASAVWRVQKMTFGAGGDISTEWADGNSSFDNIWDNRASLSYS